VVAKVFIFAGDSIEYGSGNLSLVTAEDFTRWTGTAWPGTAPKDVSIPDVYMLSPKMPYGVTTTSRVASATPTTVVTAVAIFTGTVTDVDRWVYVLSGTGQGQRRRITLQVSTTAVTVGTWTVTPDTTSVLEFWTDSHSFASLVTDAVANTTVITKNASSPDWAGLTNTWVQVTDGTGKGQVRRIVSKASGDIIVVAPALATTPDVNGGLREMTGANTVNTIADITAAKFAVRNLRFYQDASATSYSDPYHYPNYLGGPLVAGAHPVVDAINAIPETMWRLRSDHEGAIYGINVSAGGATLASFNLSNLLPLFPLGLFSGGAFSWTVDVEHLDFRPGATNGLYGVLQGYVTALAGILGAIDVQGVFWCLGTNDSINAEKAAQFHVNMDTLRAKFRSWLVANSHTTLKASSVPWIMDRVGPSVTRTYSSTVNTAIDQLAADDITSEAVDVSDIAYSADTVHPNQEGYITKGERRYVAWKAARSAIADATTPSASRDTLATIRTRVRRRYERITASTDTLSDSVDYYINESLREIYNRLGDNAWFLRIRDTITLSANYPKSAELPLTMSRPIRFEDSRYPGRRVKWRAVGRGNEGRFIVSFDQTMQSPMVVFYRIAPDDMTEDDDVCLVPHEHIELVTVLTCRGLAESSGNATAIALYGAKAQELWQLMLRDAARFQQQFDQSMDADGTDGDWPLPSSWSL